MTMFFFRMHADMFDTAVATAVAVFRHGMLTWKRLWPLAIMGVLGETGAHLRNVSERVVSDRKVLARHSLSTRTSVAI